MPLARATWPLLRGHVCRRCPSLRPQFRLAMCGPPGTPLVATLLRNHCLTPSTTSLQPVGGRLPVPESQTATARPHPSDAAAACLPDADSCGLQLCGLAFDKELVPVVRLPGAGAVQAGRLGVGRGRGVVVQGGAPAPAPPPHPRPPRRSKGRVCAGWGRQAGTGTPPCTQQHAEVHGAACTSSGRCARQARAHGLRAGFALLLGRGQQRCGGGRGPAAPHTLVPPY